MSQVQLLIFDLDGTLIDSGLDLALSVNAMRERMGLTRLPNEEIATYVGHGVANLVRRSLGEQATEEKIQGALEFFLTYYRAHMLDNTVTYPGVREALEELKGRHLTVLTNKPVRFSELILEGLGIAGYFRFIYGGNSFEQKKPDPMGANKLMSDLQASPRETMMIGDSDTDVLTGKNAGIWTCGVTYGFGSYTLENALPDFTIDDLRQLPFMLNGRGAESNRQ
ncbi:MAG: HAD-IA family hydrolase [Acidobacteria bacterium]|nr:HAD-IA family hydrolase [Acidobacteriota bacterium]